MKLEDQVCSLELAKRLKELGVKQESVCKWTRRKQSEKHVVDFRIHGPFQSADRLPFLAAFTVAELGEMLRPKEVVGSATFIRKNGQWRCVPPVQLQHLPSQDADTEADARAKMLVYLIENQFISV